MDDCCPRKRKSNNQKDGSSKQGPYQEFNKDSAQAWKALIGLHAEKAIAHTDANGRSCHQGFVKNLVNAVSRVASVSQIMHLDINNEVRRIRFKREAAMTVQREVSLLELFALLEPSTTIMTCSASDTLSSLMSNVEENTIQELLNGTPSHGLLASSGLNLLASVAAKFNYRNYPIDAPTLAVGLLFVWCHSIVALQTERAKSIHFARSTPAHQAVPCYPSASNV
jgi:hypothetical protein